MAANTLTRGRLRRLAELRPEHGRVLSVFVNLDPTEFATPPARATAVTSVVTEAQQRVEKANDLDHEEKAALRADVERVRELLKRPDTAANGTHGLAIYACGPADLLEVVRLPHPIEAGVVVDRRPFVEPLVQAGAPERWCVLLVNRRSARVFAGDGDRLEETDRIEDDVHRQHDQGGWSQANYQRSVEKEKDDHVGHAADVLFRRFKFEPFAHLAIGAPSELVTEIEGRLHPYLRKRLSGRVQLDVENASVEDVRRAAQGVMEKDASRREREALDRLTQAVGTGGRGAAGLADALAALNEARVELLLVDEGFRAPGRIDRETGLLAPPDGPADGSEPVDDIVEPAIERAIEQSAEVLIVRRHPDLRPLGRIGAVLRF
jgi:peptide chain release factor subunit 1